MPQPTAIPNLTPATQLFTWELTKANAVFAHNNQTCFTTPFGTHQITLALCGTLTDIEKNGDLVTTLRVSDPTGLCIIQIDGRNETLQQVAAKLEAPCFLYALGDLRLPSLIPNTPILNAESIQEITRTTRDTWITETAAKSAARIHTCADKELQKQFATAITTAINTAIPAQPQNKPPQSALNDEQLIELIRSLYEGKAAARTKVISALTNKGLTTSEANERIAHLMEDGELYAPRADILKLI